MNMSLVAQSTRIAGRHWHAQYMSIANHIIKRGNTFEVQQSVLTHYCVYCSNSTWTGVWEQHSWHEKISPLPYKQQLFFVLNDYKLQKSKSPCPTITRFCVCAGGPNITVGHYRTHFTVDSMTSCPPCPISESMMLRILLQSGCTDLPSLLTTLYALWLSTVHPR